jgi:hypothetical protein
MGEVREPIQLNEGIAIFANHCLISAMIACVAISLVQFGEYVFPVWQGGYLPWVIFGVALEGTYTTRGARKLAVLSPEWLLYRGVELVVILFGLRVGLFFLRDFSQFTLDWEAWREGFWVNIFSVEYLIAAFLVILFWILAIRFASDLADLEVDEYLQDEFVPVDFFKERDQVRQHLIDQILVYGTGMVILVSLMRADLELFIGMRPAMRSSVLNVVAYFVLALALLSQTQLIALRTSWRIQKIELNVNLTSRWVIFSVLFLIGLAILAIFLPTGYSLGFLAMLGTILSIFIFAITFIWQVILFLFFALLSVFGITRESMNFQPPAPPPPLASDPSTGFEMPPWLEVLRMLLFGFILAGVISYSLYQYQKQHRAVWEKFGRFPLVLKLKAIWIWLIKKLVGANQIIIHAVERRVQQLQLARRGDPLGDLRGLLSLRHLSPKEKVRFYYLAMIRRGKDYGIPRQPNQTPQEYQEKLRTSLPEVEGDIDALTDAFLEARYSQHEIGEDLAGLVRRWWERIRRILRRDRKGGIDR